MTYAERHPHPGPRPPEPLSGKDVSFTTWVRWHDARARHAMAAALDLLLVEEKEARYRVPSDLDVTELSDEQIKVLGLIALYCQQLGEPLPEDLFP